VIILVSGTNEEKGWLFLENGWIFKAVYGTLIGVNKSNWTISIEVEDELGNSLLDIIDYDVIKWASEDHMDKLSKVIGEHVQVFLRGGVVFGFSRM
jgi:hypothetical protein